MIQSAFKNAYTQQIGTQNQGINTITGGITGLALLIAGTAAFASGSSGALATGLKYGLANRIGGVGGAIMVSSMQQKEDSIKKNNAQQEIFTREEIGQTIGSELGNNPINRSAIKQLNTVFDTLIQAKEQQIINKKGKIESSMGDIDPNSELGKKILGGLSE